MAASVAVTTAGGLYPDAFPFDPDEAYPEYGDRPTGGSNPAYRAVRDALAQLGLDRERHGTAAWNPLGHVVRPGDRVFIKPNLVTHEYRKSCGRPGDLFACITHPSVVRAVADYAAIALQGSGEIIIGDNPSIDADFAVMMQRTRLDELASIVPARFGVACRVLDLRPLVCDDLRHYGVRSKMARQPGDPDGSTVVDLGRGSLFSGLNPLLFRGVFSDRLETIRHHFGPRHEYDISNSIYDADVYISVPKLKAHHKVGATLNVKGLVGINSSKNYLIHWRIGVPKFGGDEFPDPPKIVDYAVLAVRHGLMAALPDKVYARLKRRTASTPLGVVFADIELPSFKLHRGAWHGNDTCWRMAADLYNAFILDTPGQRARPQRHFTVIDGIVGGEGNGPFCPDRVESKSVIASDNLLAADVAAIRWMDYDLRAVRYATHLLAATGLDPASIAVTVDGAAADTFFSPEHRYCGFSAPSHWENLPLHGPEIPARGKIPA